ncbi:uncharacterized protein F13E9.13, mitochondrial-like [Scyliorhinus torazame]|uniref:uncharacterized protein F13E9.13, mitochondrial-like n=1 Tax=Scyliorhinus torazame TaxID=75743 RepID=UPI003B597A02
MRPPSGPADSEPTLKGPRPPHPRPALGRLEVAAAVEPASLCRAGDGAPVAATSMTVGPEVTATMATICATVRHSYPNIPLGVQILSAANKQALPVALAADADFIRVEGFVFSQISGEGFLDACAGSLLRYRKQIGAEHIQIFTDIKKKHSSHGVTSDISVAETARAAEFFLSDGVILTGIATGMQANPKEPMEIKQAVRIPAFIGSGVSVENVEEYMAADAMIIGSHFKKAGYWANEVDFERIKKFMTKINQLRK